MPHHPQEPIRESYGVDFEIHISSKSSSAMSTFVPLPPVPASPPPAPPPPPHSPPQRVFDGMPLWEVIDGASYCQLTGEGQCVSTGPPPYGPYEGCTVRALANVRLGYVVFDTADEQDAVNIVRCVKGCGDHNHLPSSNPAADPLAAPRLLDRGSMIECRWLYGLRWPSMASDGL